MSGDLLLAFLLWSDFNCTFPPSELHEVMNIINHFRSCHHLMSEHLFG